MNLGFCLMLQLQRRPQSNTEWTLQSHGAVGGGSMATDKITACKSTGGRTHWGWGGCPGWRAPRRTPDLRSAGSHNLQRLANREREHVTTHHNHRVKVGETGVWTHRKQKGLSLSLCRLLNKHTTSEPAFFLHGCDHWGVGRACALLTRAVALVCNSWAAADGRSVSSQSVKEDRDDDETSLSPRFIRRGRQRHPMLQSVVCE